MESTPSRVYSFDVFRFDASTGELWRNGHSLPMPERASRILGCLLARAGGVVTREELRQVLWPDGEHVDYDHSISNNISRLRAILRDNLSSPAYIATVSKRGYRFIATVHTSEAEAALPSSVSSETLAASEPPVIEPVPPLGEAPPPSETPLSLIRPVIN